MTTAIAPKPKVPPPLPDQLTEVPDISYRYRPRLNGIGGGQVWCIVGKRSRDELEDFDFPSDKEKEAKARLQLFKDLWERQHSKK